MELCSPPNVSGWREGGAFVKPGRLLNRYSIMDELVDDDMQYTMDYRALYQSVLAGGLGIDGKSAYLNPFQDARPEQLVQAD
jgi:uncharacterized protein (DUF1501 family)